MDKSISQQIGKYNAMAPAYGRKPLRMCAEDVEIVRQMIRVMSRDSLLYRMLKDELSALGHWKNKPRGKPAFQ